MFKVGDIVEITAKSSATGMLDFVDGKGYTILGTAHHTTNLTEPVKVYYLKIKVRNESGVDDWYTASHFKLKEEVKMGEKECLFKEGQVVWDTSYGRGVVTYSTEVQAQVKFDSQKEGNIWFTQDGVYQTPIGARNRTLYFSEPKIEAATEPLFEPVLKKGQPIILTHFGVEVQMVAGWVHEERQNEIEVMTGRAFSTTYSKDEWAVYYVGEKIEFN